METDLVPFPTIAPLPDPAPIAAASAPPVALPPVALPPVALPPVALPPVALPPPNPLLQLPDAQKEDLFVWLRENCAEEFILERIAELGLVGVTRRHIDQFFKAHAQERWTRRIDRAVQEADALVRLVQGNPGQFSNAILAALGQEAFRQIASGKVEPGALAKYTSLFLRAKEQDRAERSLQLQETKARQAHRTTAERALDAFARDLPQNPAALAAFEQLRRQLLEETEHLPEELL